MWRHLVLSKRKKTHPECVKYRYLRNCMTNSVLNQSQRPDQDFQTVTVGQPSLIQTGKQWPRVDNTVKPISDCREQLPGEGKYIINIYWPTLIGHYWTAVSKCWVVFHQFHLLWALFALLYALTICCGFLFVNWGFGKNWFKCPSY